MAHYIETDFWKQQITTATIYKKCITFCNKPMLIHCVIVLQELSRQKELVRNIDPAGFVVVMDTMEVMARRIGSQPHW